MTKSNHPPESDVTIDRATFEQAKLDIITEVSSWTYEDSGPLHFIFAVGDHDEMEIVANTCDAFTGMVIRRCLGELMKNHQPKT